MFSTKNFTKKVIIVLEEAKLMGADYIGTEHLLLAILASSTSASKLLQDHGITYEKAKARVEHLLAQAA